MKIRLQIVDRKSIFWSAPTIKFNILRPKNNKLYRKYQNNFLFLILFDLYGKNNEILKYRSKFINPTGSIYQMLVRKK